MAEMVLPRWTFADKLRKVRMTYTRFTRDQFADQLGYGQSRYGAWEDGRNVPKDEIVWDIACRINELYRVPQSWMVAE